MDKRNGHHSNAAAYEPSGITASSAYTSEVDLTSLCVETPGGNYPVERRPPSLGRLSLRRRTAPAALIESGWVPYTVMASYPSAAINVATPR